MIYVSRIKVFGIALPIKSLYMKNKKNLESLLINHYYFEGDSFNYYRYWLKFQAYDFFFIAIITIAKLRVIHR